MFPISPRGGGGGGGGGDGGTREGVIRTERLGHRNTTEGIKYLTDSRLEELDPQY